MTGPLIAIMNPKETLPIIGTNHLIKRSLIASRIISTTITKSMRMMELQLISFLTIMVDSQG